MDTSLLDVLSNVIEVALEGKQEPFELIKSFGEYVYMTRRRRSIKAITKVLSKCYKRLFKSYCKETEIGEQQLTKLLACTTIENALNFYKRDLLTIDKMLGEYEIYLMSGNQLDFLLLNRRKDSELYDYRELWK